MKIFAKLYEYEDIGQVLVTLDAADDDSGAPAITIWFTLDGLGVCKLKSTFENEDNDKAWDQAEESFLKVSQDRTYTMVQTILKSLNLV